MQELISVIIPVYNVEKYLNRCIESVVNQSYKNLEIILVDDGSPDNSPQLCDEWAKKDVRIRVIHKANGGLSDARNCGIKASKGEYITLVDSDDYIRSDMLEIMHGRMLKDSSDMAVCNYELVGDWEIGNYYPVKDELLMHDEALLKTVGDYYWHFDVACARLYKRFLFDKVEFPVGKLHEDVFTTHHFYDNCKSISFISDAMYYYYKNDSSIVHVYNIKRLDIVDAVFDRFNFFYNKGDYTSSHLCLSRAKDKLLQAYESLDLSDKNAKSALKKYKKEYNRRLLKILFKPCGFRQKPILFAFSLGYGIFGFLDKMNQKIRHSQD